MPVCSAMAGPMWAHSLSEQLRKAAEWANVDTAQLLTQADAITAALDSGRPRELDRLLRTICPADMWDWPAYAAYAEEAHEKPTRIRMVAALEHRLMRDDHWARHMPQLLANLENRPLWQFRAVDDGQDPPECKQLSGRVERFDSEFWQSHGPTTCDKVRCRCTIRAYRLDEAIAS